MHPVPRQAFEGLEALRLSGRTNMLDRPRVADLAEALGFEAARAGFGRTVICTRGACSTASR
jgi:hypothetical protein